MLKKKSQKVSWCVKKINILQDAAYLLFRMSQQGYLIKINRKQLIPDYLLFSVIKSTSSCGEEAKDEEKLKSLSCV